MFSNSKSSVYLLIQEFYAIFLSVSKLYQNSVFVLSILEYGIISKSFFNIINSNSLNYQLYGYFWGVFSTAIWRFKYIKSFLFLLYMHVSMYSLYSCTSIFIHFKKYIYLGCCTFWHFYGKSSIWMDAWHIFGSTKNPPSWGWNHCSISYIWNL